MIKLVEFQDVAGKQVIVNTLVIRMISARNADHVNIQFDKDHIQVVRGTIPDVITAIDKA